MVEMHEFITASLAAEVKESVWFFVSPWTVAHQAPLSMGFSGKNTGVGSHALLQGVFQHRDWTWVSYNADRFFTIWGTGEALVTSFFIIDPLVHGQPGDGCVIKAGGIGMETEISVFVILKGSHVSLICLWPHWWIWCDAINYSVDLFVRNIWTIFFKHKILFNDKVITNTGGNKFVYFF